MVVMVMLIISAIVMFVFTEQIDIFNSGADNLENQGCEFQQQKVANSDELDQTDLSDKCKDSSSIAQIEQAAADALSQLQSGDN